MWVISGTSSQLVFPMRWKKRHHIVCIQEDLPTTLYWLFLAESNKDEISQIFLSYVSPFVSLIQNPFFSVLERIESQVQRHITHYILTLKMYKSQ